MVGLGGDTGAGKNRFCSPVRRIEASCKDVRSDRSVFGYFTTRADALWERHGCTAVAGGHLFAPDVHRGVDQPRHVHGH